MIEVKNISKNFYVHEKEPGLKASIKSLFYRKKIEKQALKDVSFNINRGEIVGLVGANGAGKTTLVKILSGIIHPTFGEAKVLGYDPWKRSNELRSKMSLIMGQKAQLWWDLPALDCFLLLKEIYKIPNKQYKDNLDFLTNTLNIKNQLNIQIRRLSLGERMKMELIAALLHNPKVVYLDEPTIGLDLTAQKAIRDFILFYRQKYNPAMILTSHYMEDIIRLCKRIIIIKQGRIVYDGDLHKVVSKYVNHKIIEVRYKPYLEEKIIPKEFGKILEKEKTFIKLKVAPKSLLKATNFILKTFEVEDLTITHDDISSIIEALLRDSI